MDSNAVALQTIALWVLILSIVFLLPTLVFTLSAKQKRQEKEWEFVAKGVYHKIGAKRQIYGSWFTTILFTDGTSCTVVDMLDNDLPASGTYIEVEKTKKGNNFRIKTSIPPSSCL